MARRRSSCLLILVLTASSASAQSSPTMRPDPLRDELTATADDFAHRVRSAGFEATSPIPAILVDTPPQLSMYTRKSNTIHTSGWEELTPDVQDTCARWANHAGDRTGKQLFDEMFHRFFFVHELGHWLQIQSNPDTNDVYAFELEANRLTVAYWREKDSRYLTGLLARFERINGGLPNPVPDGEDAEAYFNANYTRLGSHPDVYGWFQTRMVIRAGGERPVRTFADAVRRLRPK